MSECTSRFGFDQRCILDAGHDGKHASKYITWTENESATSQAAVLKQMRGRTE